MEVRVTQHAVERFIKRCRPDLTFWRARMKLKEWMRHARPLRQRSSEGDIMYEYGDYWFVLKNDPGFHKPAVVTVLDRVQVEDDEFED